MKKEIKIKDSIVTYQGFFNIYSYNLSHKKYNNSWSKTVNRELLIKSPSVALLPFDPKNSQVLLVQQLRLGAYMANCDPWQIELITGNIDGKDQNPKSAILREAREEANLIIKKSNTKLISTVLNSSGTTNEKTFIFFCEINLRDLGGVFGTDGEDIKLLNLNISDAFKMVKNMKIKSVNTIIALNWLKENIDEK